jgi:hypothetical protein
LGTAAAASSSFASTVASYESNQHGVVLRRQLNEIITAATCAKMGTVDAYPARLDLVYVYALEFYDPLDDLLYGVERAIATSVASTLTTCTAAEGASTTQSSMPMFAVELSDFSAHRVIDSSTTSTGKF